MNVPVFLYHAVTETPGDIIAPYTVSPDEFARQLDAIIEAGYRCITFSELMDAFALGPAKEKVAVITFDDGYADFVENALPLLTERNLVSTMYLTTAFMAEDRDGFNGPTDKMLSFSQIPEMVAAGTEIGAHSHSHPELDTCRRLRLFDEVNRPKILLEDALQAPVRSYAYPHGYNGPRVQAMVKRIGYDNAAGVRNALTNERDDRFNVARLMLESHHDIGTFKKWLAGQADVAQPGESFKTKGWRTYRRTKSVIAQKAGSVYQ